MPRNANITPVFYLKIFTEIIMSNSTPNFTLPQALAAYNQANYETAIPSLLNFAEQSPIARFYLGEACTQGYGVPQDSVQAAKHYQQAAEQGYLPAQAKLGECYAKGIGVERDFRTAAEWFIKAAESEENRPNQKLDNAKALFEQGDYEAAVREFTELVEQDTQNATAHFYLGEMYAVGHGVELNSPRAVEHYTQSAEQGYASAQAKLGQLYALGVGVPQDFRAAAKWLGKAAEQQENLPENLLEKAQTFTQTGDYDDALAIYRELAQQTHADAQYQLGDLYLQGLGVEKNPRRAADWFFQAASQGKLEAFNELKQLAEQGDASIQFDLARLYALGLGVSRDDMAAADWFTQSAEQGYTPAQAKLGEWYAAGKGVQQSYANAAEWYRKAAISAGEIAADTPTEKQPEPPVSASETSETQPENKMSAEEQVAKIQTALNSNNLKAAAAAAAMAAGISAPMASNISSKRELVKKTEPLPNDADEIAILNSVGEALTQKLDDEEDTSTEPQPENVATKKVETQPETTEPQTEKAEKAETQPEKATDEDKLSDEEIEQMLENGIAAYDRGEYATTYSIFSYLAEQGNAQAQYYFGLMHEKGLGVAQDDRQASVWYLRAADQGYAPAEYSIGVSYAVGLGILQNYHQAHHWYERAANQEYTSAQVNLGELYAHGLGAEQDFEKSAYWFERAAQHGDPIAQYNLAIAYSNGQGVEKDDAKAIEWFTRAADQGDAAAQYNLGVRYENGDGVEQSYTKAAEWYQKSAEQGFPNAQNNLGLLYADGNGVEQDFDKAADWCEQAADQGHVDAQFNLGLLYQALNTQEGLRQAAAWYLKAAEQGHAEAQTNLAISYFNGWGVEQSDDEAIKWYRAAAGQGVVAAQYGLGWLHFNAEPKRLDLAEQWWQAAADQGDEHAKQGLEEIRNLRKNNA